MIFFDFLKIKDDSDNQTFFSRDDLERYMSLEKEMTFLKQCLEFLKSIELAFDKMIDLLDTTSISDMHEAINFFVTAYQFNVDKASTGITGTYAGPILLYMYDNSKIYIIF